MTTIHALASALSDLELARAERDSYRRLAQQAIHLLRDVTLARDKVIAFRLIDKVDQQDRARLIFPE